MPRSSKRARSANVNNAGAASSNDAPRLSDAPHVYQLTVINSCARSEDIRLPTAPTPALLSSFYAECDAWAERVCGASLATAAAFTPWKAEYWLRRVPHVPLGRHSALPEAFRLRHDCVSRLQARVVYIRAAQMHKRFAKYFPPVVRTETEPHANERDYEQSEVKNADENDDDDVVVVEPVEASSTVPPSPLFEFEAPYYLLVNYGDNFVYVGHDAVGCGRSAVLREGDVISFLECAFDDDGGILDCPGAAASQTDDAPCEELAEPCDELILASVQSCLSHSATPLPRYPLYVDRRLVALRRHYDVPFEVQEYVQWWRTQQLQENKEDPAAAPALRTSPSTSSPGLMVLHNHLVRAPSVTSVRDSLSRTPERPSLQPVEKQESSSLPKQSPEQADMSTCFANVAEVGPFIRASLSNPVIAASLRRWLDTTEDLEEVADAVVSPLSTRLALDRAWLRRCVRRYADEQRHCEASRVASTPPRHLGPAKIEDEKGDSLIAHRTPNKQNDSLVESFRVLVSPQQQQQGQEVTTPQRPCATPPREPSVVQAALDELRRSRRVAAEDAAAFALKDEGEDDAKTVTATNSLHDAARLPPVRRSLRLDDDPIELFSDNSPRAEKLRHVGKRGESCEVSSPMPAFTSSRGALTSAAALLPGVRIVPAALPVYVFSRRSRSPDVYTRNGASLRPFSSIARDKTMASSAASSGATHYVYYFESEEEEAQSRAHHSGGNGGASSRAEGQVQLTEGGDVGFQWIDEAEVPARGVASAKAKGKTRKTRRKR